MKSRRRFYQPARRADTSPSAAPETAEVQIDKLSHDGRGISRHQGKTLFVAGALPGELVRIRYLKHRSKFDEARCEEVLEASEQRCQPACRHFSQCGGCELQHLSSEAQISARQQQALDQLRRLGGIEPNQILPALDALHWHYRRRARLAVQHPKKGGRPVVGFRRRQSKQLIAISECPVLESRAEQLLPQISALLAEAVKPRAISHIELALGDEDAALVIRHIRPLADPDLNALQQLAGQHGFQLWLQPQGPETLRPLNSDSGRLRYRLDDQQLTLAFHPGDFTQVNAAINQQMVSRTMRMLDPGPEDRILDLFCGLGNFTLPLATRAGEVIGIEGSEQMVERGYENARANGIRNVEFHCADLSANVRHCSWFRNGFNKILLDPPRAGAAEVIAQLAQYRAEKILYISCDPATLARDAAALIRQGYRLEQWGVMNMFPQTTHVESIALFQR